MPLLRLEDAVLRVRERRIVVDGEGALEGRFGVRQIALLYVVARETHQRLDAFRIEINRALEFFKRLIVLAVGVEDGRLQDVRFDVVRVALQDIVDEVLRVVLQVALVVLLIGDDVPVAEPQGGIRVFLFRIGLILIEFDDAL